MANIITPGEVQQAYAPDFAPLSGAIQQAGQNQLLAAQRALAAKKQAEEDQYKNVELANQVFPYEHIGTGTDADPALNKLASDAHNSLSAFLLNPNVDHTQAYTEAIRHRSEISGKIDAVNAAKGRADKFVDGISKENPWLNTPALRNKVYQDLYLKNGEFDPGFDPNKDVYSQFNSPAALANFVNPAEFQKAQLASASQLFPMPAEDTIIQQNAAGKQFRDSAGLPAGLAYRAPQGFDYTGDGVKHSFAPQSVPVQVGNTTLPALAPQLYNRIAGSPLFDIPIAQRVQTMAAQNPDFAQLPVATQQSLAAYQVASELPGKVGASAKFDYGQQNHSEALADHAFSHNMQEANLNISKQNLALSQQRAADEKTKKIQNTPYYTPNVWANQAKSPEALQRLNAVKQTITVPGYGTLTPYNLNAVNSDVLTAPGTNNKVTLFRGKGLNGKEVLVEQYMQAEPQTIPDPKNPNYAIPNPNAGQYTPSNKYKVVSPDVQTKSVGGTQFVKSQIPAYISAYDSQWGKANKDFYSQNTQPAQ